MKLLTIFSLCAIPLAAAQVAHPWTLYCSNTSCTDRSNAVLHGVATTGGFIPCVDFPTPYKLCTIEWDDTPGLAVEGEVYPGKGCTGTDSSDHAPVRDGYCTEEWVWRPQRSPFVSFKGIEY